MPPKLTHGHRAVLQVAKVETVTDTVFSQTRTRHKLWLSDGNRWTIAFASELAGATAGCLVRVLKYHSTNELNIHEMELESVVASVAGAANALLDERDDLLAKQADLRARIAKTRAQLARAATEIARRR